ncbi:hypothetical protein DYL59_08535 [Pseudomonas kairouanensis]|uniref:Uncharacterized protein n=1 Tax=Pseudomonas kairouanensis TaxID=2293832 RepID=A0A4Z0AW65_9PSED|nr:hypothetical protein DYL59_08535 [Pseudomonas kairouanensis]
MLAKVVNDKAGFLGDRAALTFFASKLASTGSCVSLCGAHANQPCSHSPSLCPTVRKAQPC